MNKKPVYITTSEVAGRFGVNSATVRRWVLTGQLIPDITTPGGHHRFTEETVANLESNSAPAVAAHSQARSA